MNKLTNYAMALMMGMGLMGVSATAHAEGVTPFYDIGVQSQYIWRGAAQGEGQLSVQGDVGVDAGNGFSANVWFATGVGAKDNSFSEYDITVDYSGEAGDIDYSVGYIMYRFTDFAEFLDAEEFYLGASYGIASATLYVGDGYNYTEFGAGTTVADMFDASVAFGIVSPDTGSSVNQTTFGLSKDFDNISANLTVGTFDTADTEFAIGVNASF